MNKQEFDKGYKAAIEAIKQKLQNQGKNNKSNSSNDKNDDLGLPEDPDDMDNGSGSNDDNSKDSKSSQSRGSGDQGVVRPEDCVGPDDLNDVPDTPGGMIDKGVGDKMAEKEGYDKEGPNADGIEKDWKDKAMKAAAGMKAGNKLRAKIETLYKTSTNWKKELRAVVGQAISPDDKRSAYANKNVLVAQDRIARTDKDKYDSMDYMMAVIDTSGSMSTDQLRMCLSEVYAMALQKKPIKIVVVYCDADIQGIVEYTDLRKLKHDATTKESPGGGGTDFKPVWDLFKTDKKFKRTNCELVMCFTDGGLWNLNSYPYKRDPLHMRYLCWVILDNPGWQIPSRDPKTKAVYLNTKDIK